MGSLEDRQNTFSGVLLLANRMQTTYDAALGELTLKQWLVLAVMANLPLPIPSTAVVARAIGTTHQNARKLLGALAGKGYVRFEQSPDDRRARQVALTPRAHDYFAHHETAGTRLLDELFAGIPAPDVATCLRVLNSMSLSLTGDSLIPPSQEE